MIFKIFENDVDKISAKWGIFGRSFNDIDNAITNKLIDFNNEFERTGKITSSWKNTDSVWKRLYGNKNELDWIKNSVGDIITNNNIDSLIPEIALNDAKNKVADILDWNNEIKTGNKSWQDYFETLGQGEQYIVNVIKSTDDLTKLTGDDLVQANQQARTSALAHNNALQQQTLGAKAAALGMKALITVGNMLATWGITKAVTLIAEGIDTLANSAEHCKDRVDSLIDSYKSSLDIANSNAERIEEFADRYEELSKGVNKLGQNVSLTNDEYAEYNSLVNEIADMFPTLVQGYTSQGNAILSLKGNVEGLRDAYKEAQREAYNLLIKTGEDSDGNDIISNWKNTQSTSILDKFLDFGADDVGGGISTSDALDQLKAVQNMTADEYREIKRIIGSGSSEEILGLTELEKEIGTSSFLYNALGLNDGISDKDFAEAKKEALALVHTYQAEIDSALSGVRTLANAYLMTNEDYSGLDEKTQNVASLIVNSLSENIASGFDEKTDVDKYIIDVLEGLDNQNVQDAITKLFSTNFDEMPISDVKNKLMSYINVIASTLDENADDLAIRLGFEDELTVADSYKNMVDSAKKSITDAKGITDRRERHAKYGQIEREINKFAKEYSINTQDEIAAFNKALEESNYEIEIAFSNYLSRIPKNTAITQSFSDIFNSSDFSEQKEALLELAKAGELTNEALASDDYKDLINALDGIGISTNQAKNEILSLLDSTEKLSGASKVISGLEDAYNEFSESGYVSAETIESIPDIFRELETYDFDLFKNIIGNPDSEIDEVQQAFNEIVSAYINEQGTLMNVSEQEASRFIHNLEKMGIVNAKAIVDSVTALKGSLVELEKEADSTMESLNTFLIKQGKDAVTSTDDITQCTWSELEALIRVGGQYDFNTDKIKEYVTKKIWCNQNSIDVTADINQLIMAAKAAGLAADSIAIYEKAKELHNKGYGGGKEWLESMEQSVYKDILKEIETLYKIESEKYSPTDNETKSSDPWKEEFDRYLSDLKHMLEMNEITEAQYYNTLDKLNQKYFANKQEYLEEYWQYEEEVYKGYLSLQEQASDAIHNLVDLRIDMIKYELEKELEAEKEKLDLLNEQINARKEAIELLKDERDHAEEMAEKNKAISDIQNELNALKYDDSAAAQKKRRELEEELAEAEKDLTDYIRDYEYNQAIDALDKEAEEAEKAYEEKEKSIQEHLDDEKRLLGEAINDINGMNETLYDNMKTWALETTGEVWKVVEAWKAAQEALDTYNAKSKVPEIDETLHNNITNETVVDNAAGTVPVTIYKKDGSTVTEFDSVGGNSGNNSNSNSNAGSNNNNNTDLNNKSYKAIHTIKSKDDTLWSLAEKYYGDGNKWKKISEANGNIKPEELTIGKKLYIPYKHGTTKVPDDTLALVDEVGQELILRANEQGRLDILTKGTSVIPANITEKLMMWGQQSPTSFAQCLSTKLSSMSLPDIISRETAPVISIGDININGNMGNLTRSDLNEFRKGIVNDVYESMQKNRVKSGRY